MKQHAKALPADCVVAAVDMSPAFEQKPLNHPETPPVGSVQEFVKVIRPVKFSTS